jgi:hypothetical protein
LYKCSNSCLWCSCWWNLNFSFKSYGKESLYKYCMNVDDGRIMHSWRSCLFLLWSYARINRKWGLSVSYGTTFFEKSVKIINSNNCAKFEVNSQAKGFSIYSVIYEKTPTIWWIKSHNSGMKNLNFTKKYTDHKTINNSLQISQSYWNWWSYGLYALWWNFEFSFQSYGLYSSNCRRFFVCRAVNWEPLGQFTSNFA